MTIEINGRKRRKNIFRNLFFSIYLIYLIFLESSHSIFCPIQQTPSSQPEFPLRTCSFYDENSCCLWTETLFVDKYLNYITSAFILTGAPQLCYQQLEILTCGLYCSPGQVLYVDASPQQFRVCNSFCQTLYRACSNVMIQGQNRTVQDLYSTPDLFCQQFAPLEYQVITKQNSDLCFPGLDTPTSAAQSYAFGSGLYQGLAGFDTVWYIQAVDVFQNKKLVGGDPFLVQEFPNINSLDFIDNKDGTYTVSYIPDALTYNFSVTLLSEFIKNSPFSVTYLNSTTCPLTRGGELPYHPTNPIIATSNCSRYQNTACCSAQDLANLQLWIEDNSIQEIYGTSPLCLHYWDLFLCGAPCAPYQSEFITFDQIGNTTELTYELCPEFCSAWYSACYNVTTVGGLTVGYLFNSTQFCESHTLLNISVNIRNTSCFSGTDRNTSAPNSCPYGEGLVGFHEAGSNNSFIIQAADIYGNNRTTGGDNFTVILEGPNNITIVANVTDNMDGTYLVVYNATIAGNYEIIVTLNGEPVCNSPFFVSILPGPPTNNSYFICPFENCFATFAPGAIITFIIQAVDQYGNLVRIGGAEFTVLVVGPSLVTPQVIDNGNGTYTVVICPECPGNYTILVLLDGVPIIGNQPPCTFQIPECDFSASRSIISNYQFGFACDLGPATFNIISFNNCTACDSSYNKGGEVFNISIVGPPGDGCCYVGNNYTIIVQVIDFNNGTYLVNWFAPVAGYYTITVTWNEIPLSNSPVVAYLLPGTFSPNESFVFGNGLQGIKQIGETENFYIQPTDACCNNITDTEIVFQANITGIDVNTTIPNTIEYLGPLYKDTYIPTVSGNYSIVVFSLSPKAGIIRTLEACIRNTPTYIDIPLQPCLSCVDTFGPGVTVAVSSTQEQQNAFFILTRDCSGNPLGVGGAEFDIGVFYKNQQLTSFVNPSVLDLNNGIYYVQYYAQLDGPVDMVIKMNTSSGYQPITGSPFRIYFEQGSSCLSYNNCTQNGWCQSGACNCLNGWPNNNPECAILPAPTLQSAYFWDTGVVIQATFLYPMNITGINAPFNCDNVFTNTNFGQDQDVDRINKNCLYLNSTTLLILLGQGATILPGDNLTLIDGSSVQVAPPINPLIPQVQIIGPAVISACDLTVLLDARSSRGIGGRPPTSINWTVANGPNSNNIQTTLQSVDLLYLQLDTSILAFNYTYTFTLSLTNVFGNTGSQNISFVRTSLYTPTVTILAPDIANVQTNQAFILAADVNTSCLPGIPSYGWTRKDKNGPILDLNLATSVQQNLAILSNTFSANSEFTLELTVSVNNDLENLGRDNVRLIVNPPDNFAQIDWETGTSPISYTVSRKKMSRLSTLYLDASSSAFLDLNIVEGVPGMTWVWDCWQIHPRQCPFCLDPDAKEAYIGTNQSAITIPPATFQPGEYVFQTTVTDKFGHVSIAQVNVAIETPPIPYVHIQAIDRRVNRGDELRFFGSGVSLTNSPLTYNWVVIQDFDAPTYLDLSNPNVAITTNQPLLTLNPEVLYEYVTYTLRLEVSDENGVGYADIKFTVNGKPSMGSFIVHKLPNFYYSMAGMYWEDSNFEPHLPIFFSFSYTAVGIESPLARPQSFSSFLEARLVPIISSVELYVWNSYVPINTDGTRREVSLSSLTKKNSISLFEEKRTSVLDSGYDNALIYYQFVLSDLASKDTESLYYDILAVLYLLDFDNSNGTYNLATKDIPARQALRYQIALILLNHFVIGNLELANLMKINLLYYLVYRPIELTRDTQIVTGEYLLQLSQLVTQLGISTDEFTVQDYGNRLLNATGNILASDKSNQTTADGQLISSYLVQSLYYISQAVLLNRTYQDPPIDISSVDIAMIVYSSFIASSSLPLYYSAYVSLGTVTFQVPSSLVNYIILQSNGSIQVNSVITVTRNNLYFWSNTSQDLDSVVAGLNFYINGIPLNFQGLPQPITVSVPRFSSWPYSICQYWNNTVQGWAFDNVHISSASTKNVTVCNTNHLTYFSARNGPPPPRLVGLTPAHSYAENPLQPVKVTHIPWGIILGVAAISLLMGFFSLFYRRPPVPMQPSEEETPLEKPIELFEPPLVSQRPIAFYPELEFPSSSSEASLSLINYDLSSDESWYKKPPPRKEEASEEDDFYQKPSGATEESSSSTEIFAKGAKGEEEESSDEEGAIDKGKHPGKEDSSSEEGAIDKGKHIGKEDSSSEGDILQKRKHSGKEDSSSEGAIDKGKHPGKEESSSEGDILQKRKHPGKEESSSTDEFGVLQKTPRSFAEQSSSDEGGLLKKKTDLQEDTSETGEELFVKKGILPEEESSSQSEAYEKKMTIIEDITTSEEEIVGKKVATRTVSIQEEEEESSSAEELVEKRLSKKSKEEEETSEEEKVIKKTSRIKEESE